MPVATLFCTNPTPIMAAKKNPGLKQKMQTGDQLEITFKILLKKNDIPVEKPEDGPWRDAVFAQLLKMRNLDDVVQVCSNEPGFEWLFEDMTGIKKEALYASIKTYACIMALKAQELQPIVKEVEKKAKKAKAAPPENQLC